jgi:hypothetical protein
MGIAVSLATFLFLVYHHPPDTVGQAFLHLYYKSPNMAVLPLPNGWRARYGIDRHEQCAILLDAARTPRFMACTFGYGPGTPEYRGELVNAEARANEALGLRRHPAETITSELRSTQSGPIRHVVRTYSTSASFHVVTTGQVVEHEFFRDVGSGVLHLRTYEDAAQRSNLDSVAWRLAETMVIVPRR